MVLKRIITLFCLICTLFIPIIAKTEVIDYIVVVVNDDVIVNTELQQSLFFILKQWHEKTDRLPPLNDLEKQVLERLIMTKLQLQLAERTGIQVDNSRLNDKLRQIAAKEQHKDLQSFRNQLEKEGYSYKYVREQVRHQMILKLLQQRQVVNRINITDREIDNFLANQVKQGTVNHAYLLWHILIATPQAPSPEDIEEKQQQAKEVLAKLKQEGADFQAMAVAVSDSRQALEGGDLGWLKMGEMPTLFNKIVNKMSIGEVYGPLRDTSGFHIIKLVDKRGDEKSIVTQTKARHILLKTNELVSDLEAKFRLEELKYRIEQGDDFTELARAHSEDSGSAADGGLLDWMSPGELVPEFEEVMNDLPKKRVSEPFKSRYGWHILQVLERREHDNTEKALRTRAAQQIHQRKIEEELQAWQRQLRDEAYIEYRSKFKDDTNYENEMDDEME
ncbi:peptidylprolyl isomerase [Candidatus Parabeggiatoa sp. HSG14]|uniref:peptidylprolyl isomerase n=1 Tax=Candidatus Parabeggiatoa sp. HSG14 TaxID=3055593 RepID=UPI0025A889EF|nr:peptidylprolyl isomerase [Thiotrichales bacterium HSG14]